MGIASRRKQLGLSQNDLARQLGVDQTAVHTWERGKAMPNAKRLPAIAKILKCSVDELLQDDAEDSLKDSPSTSTD